MERSTYAPVPQQFEAGAQMAAQAIGLGVAAEYLGELGMDRVAAHEEVLSGAPARRAGSASVGAGRRSGRRPGPRRHRGVRRRRGARPRRRPGARRRRRRRPGGPPLRVAAAPPVRRSRDHAGDRRRLQRPSTRSTRSSASLDRVPAMFGSRTADHGPLPGAHPRPREAPAPRPGCASRSTPRCTRSTRPAATRSPCGSTSDGGTSSVDVSYDALGCSISVASASVLSDAGRPATPCARRSRQTTPCGRC